MCVLHGSLACVKNGKHADMSNWLLRYTVIP